MSAPFFALPHFLVFGIGRCARCSRVTDLLSGRTVTGVERDMCASCWAPDSCRVVDYPAEMGPFYCPAGCAADDAESHEDGCERYCRTHMVEVDEDGCGACREDDRFDEQAPRRPSANRWAVLS